MILNCALIEARLTIVERPVNVTRLARKAAFDLHNREDEFLRLM